MTKSTEMKKLTIKFSILMLVLATGFILLSLNDTIHQSAYAFSSSSPGGKTNSPGDAASCTQCHTGAINPPSPPTAAPVITSAGLANGYVPGQTYTINASLSGVNSQKIGFEVTAEDNSNSKTGTILITDASRTTLTNGNNAITHNGAAGTAASNGANAWTFDWTAPSAGTGDVTFYGAFNATNANFSTSGDAVWTSSFTVQEAISTSIVSHDQNAIDIYPNPVVNAMHLATTNEALKTIAIRDLSGKTLSSLQRNGQLVSIDMSTLPHGVYLIEVESEGKIWTEKIIKQ